jgi:2-dehydropantoate 2-reductase
VRHDAGTQLYFGEPACNAQTGMPVTKRLQNFVSILNMAGIDAKVSAEIKTEVWKKILGNACFNPVSLLTNSSTDLLIDDPLIYNLFESMMSEILLLGSAIGIKIETKISDRISATRKLGKIKTSMLQDAEAGKLVEIQAILGSLLAIGLQYNVQTPNLKTVYALARMRAESMGLLKVKNGHHT